MEESHTKEQFLQKFRKRSPEQRDQKLSTREQEHELRTRNEFFWR